MNYKNLFLKDECILVVKKELYLFFSFTNLQKKFQDLQKLNISFSFNTINLQGDR